MPPRALYRLFPLVARASAWSERRLTANGRLCAGLAVAGSLFGVDLGQTLAWQLAVLCGALLLAARAAGIGWRPRLRVRRVLPDCVTAGTAASYWLEIENLGRHAERDLVVVDRLVDVSVPRAALRRTASDPGPRRNWFDRVVGFQHWLELARTARGALIAEQAIATIAPGAMVRVRMPAEFLRRGRIHFAGVELLRPDPLGLHRARCWMALPASVVALPRRHGVPRLALRSARRYQRGGLSLAQSVGDALEFAGLRDYRPGDARRHIHWRSFAKTGRLIVREYLDEYFDRHALVLDTDCAAGPLFEAMVTVAASCVTAAHARDAVVDIVVAGLDVVELGRGLGDDLRALAFLAETRAAPGEDIAPLAALLTARAAQLASVILVLGAWDEPRRALARALAARGTRVLALAVCDAPPADAAGARWLRRAHLGEDLATLVVRP